MAVEKRYQCSHAGCSIAFAHEKNIPRHLRVAHGQQTRPRGRPKKAIVHRTESENGKKASPGTSYTEQSELNLRQNSTYPSAPRLFEDWWTHQPWYQEIRGKQYHWNRNGFLEKLLRLPRLDDRRSPSEDGFVKIVDPSDLPKKFEADALRALQTHHSDLKFYSKGQFDDAKRNERYPGEFYATLLFNMSAAPQSADPRHAKIPLDELDFDYSRAHIDRDFLYNPQQAEMFASPAGSWSDVHIDHFLAGLAMPIGDTMKLFVCWPACEQNLKILDEEPPGPERLTHILDRLEGGRCAIICRDTPLYLSSGCLHAVVTLRGGFMYAGNFMTAENGPAFLRSFRLSPALIGRYDDSGRRGLMANLLDQMDVTFERPSCWLPMVAEVVKSWPAIERFSRKSDQRSLAQRLLKVVGDPQWQQACDECSDLDTAKLDDIIRVQLNRRI